MNLQPLTGKALQVVDLTDATIIGYEGSVRSSKSITSLIAWLKFVRTAPPGELLIAGRTERTAKRNVIDVLSAMLGPARCRYVQGTGELHLMGRRIYVVGANDERAAEKIQGLTLVGSYCDELSTFPESFWNMLRSRHSVAGARLFFTSNPAGPAHWLLTEWLSKAKLHVTGDGTIVKNDSPGAANLHRFSFRLADNPNLPAEYVADMRKEYVGLWAKRYIEGQWVAADGAIYDMLDDAIHNQPAPMELGQCWLAIDYGTSNPTHAVLLGHDYRKDRLHIVAEWRHDGRKQRTLTDAEISKGLRDWFQALPFEHQGANIILDPSAVSLRMQLHADGWHTYSADNRVLIGIRAMSNLFAAGKLVVDVERCPHLWSELQGYVWSKKAQDEGRDEPVKVNDHGCDSGRYGICAAWGVWRNWLPGINLADAA